MSLVIDYAEQAKQDTTQVLLLQYDGLGATELDIRVGTVETFLHKTLDDISTGNDVSNLQSPHISRRESNISSIKGFFEESIITHFSRCQLADSTDNQLTIDLNDLNRN